MVCNIDHSIEDVMNKLESQKNFLPEGIFKELKSFFARYSFTEIIK